MRSLNANEPTTEQTVTRFHFTIDRLNRLTCDRMSDFSHKKTLENQKLFNESH